MEFAEVANSVVARLFFHRPPDPAGGGMVHADRFRRYDPAMLDMAFDQIIQSWDTANTPAALSDYSVCTTWGLKGGHFCLLNVFRKKLAYTDLKRAVREQPRLYAATLILVEESLGHAVYPGSDRGGFVAGQRRQARGRQTHAVACRHQLTRRPT
jgi:phage terminase large subunit-like protein